MGDGGADSLVQEFGAVEYRDDDGKRVGHEKSRVMVAWGFWRS